MDFVHFDVAVKWEEVGSIIHSIRKFLINYIKYILNVKIYEKF